MRACVRVCVRVFVDVGGLVVILYVSLRPCSFELARKYMAMLLAHLNCQLGLRHRQRCRILECPKRSWGKAVTRTTPQTTSRWEAIELPVRWSATEVLLENKFSKASDVSVCFIVLLTETSGWVTDSQANAPLRPSPPRFCRWAFGVLVYEVMSRGRQPFEKIATLAEVAERIKAGYVLQCPPGCRKEIYALVMLPCWQKEASERPGFAELCNVLTDLGAASEHEEESKRMSRLDIQAEENDDGVWATAFSTEGRPFLGPSVHHIHAVFGPKVLAAIAPPWKDRHGAAVIPATSATVATAVDAVGKPAGAKRICPRDGLLGCSYVNTLVDRDDVGRAIALLSYTWGYRLVSVGSALMRWAQQSERDPKRSYIWICSLCLNQHRFSTLQTPEQLVNEFRPRVLSIGRILPMLEPWRNPEYLKRAWCLFELYTAIESRGRVAIDVILTEEMHSDFVLAMTTEGCA